MDHYNGELSMFMRGKINSLLGCKTYILESFETLIDASPFVAYYF